MSHLKCWLECTRVPFLLFSQEPWCLLQEVSTAAHKLAVSVVEKCVDKLEPYVQRFLTSVMLEGKSLKSGLHCDCHEIIYEIYCCAPQMLLAVIPNLTQELLVITPFVLQMSLCSCCVYGFLQYTCTPPDLRMFWALVLVWLCRQIK